MRRWLIALLALTLGGGVSAVLLIFANPEREAIEVYAASRDISAGSAFSQSSVALVRVVVAGHHQLFGRNEGTRLSVLRASHSLTSGQLIQHSDATSQETVADRRLVFVPVKDAPPVTAGSKVDLLIISGSLDHLSVSPFALGVDVRAAVTGGLVVVVSTRQAPAFVYAGHAMRLTAVIADAGAEAGSEGSVSTVEQAIAVAAQP
ncbi:MAG: hypothetical protein NVS1B3_02690 [Candidatus Dormibacteraceae bacterium]